MTNTLKSTREKNTTLTSATPQEWTDVFKAQHTERNATYSPFPWKVASDYLDAAKLRESAGDKLYAWRDYVLADRYSGKISHRGEFNLFKSEAEKQYFEELNQKRAETHNARLAKIQALEAAMPEESRLSLALDKLLLRAFGNLAIPAEQRTKGIGTKALDYFKQVTNTGVLK